MLYSAGTNTSIGCPEVRTAMDALNAHTLEWFCRGCEDEVRTGVNQTFSSFFVILS